MGKLSNRKYSSLSKYITREISFNMTFLSHTMSPVAGVCLCCPFFCSSLPLFLINEKTQSCHFISSCVAVKRELSQATINNKNKKIKILALILQDSNVTDIMKVNQKISALLQWCCLLQILLK